MTRNSLWIMQKIELPVWTNSRPLYLGVLNYCAIINFDLRIFFDEVHYVQLDKQSGKLSLEVHVQQRT